MIINRPVSPAEYIEKLKQYIKVLQSDIVTGDHTGSVEAQRTKIAALEGVVEDLDLVVNASPRPLVEVSAREWDRNYARYEAWWNGLHHRVLRRDILRQAKLPGTRIFEHDDDRWDELPLEVQKLLIQHVDLAKRTMMDNSAFLPKKR